MTVLANEQVVDGKCERCSSEVVKKEMTQWFFKITDYAERLLNDLDKIDWPAKTKNCTEKIGLASPKVQSLTLCLKTKTKSLYFLLVPTHFFGVSFLAIAPEHPLVKTLTKPEQLESVEKYLLDASKKDEILRQSLSEEKNWCIYWQLCNCSSLKQKSSNFCG